MRYTWILSVMLGLLMELSATAGLRLANLFGDHMVLQREVPIPVWGWAEPGSDITLRFQGQQKSSKADDDGRWSITLDPLTVQVEGTELTVSAQSAAGTEKAILADVLVGDVWLCSGQSNMKMALSATTGGEEEIAAANIPGLRLFRVGDRARPFEVQDDCEGEWGACGPENVAEFSAAAYYFGKELHRELGNPIGLVMSSWGGTKIQAWTSDEALSRVPSAAEKAAKWRRWKANEDPNWTLEAYEQAMAQWKNDKRKGLKSKRPVPPAAISQYGPSGLYNGMIAPLVPAALRGVIWYQGEANSHTVDDVREYKQLLPNLIQSWREDFQRELPFLFVQLPNLGNQPKRQWPLMREAFLETLRSVPGTGMAVTLDIGESEDIHPRNKKDVGHRLALSALAQVYGKDLVYSGPLYLHAAFDEHQAVITFEHTGSGLVAKGGELLGFEVAGEDRVFKPAVARIEGRTVLVSSPEVPQPVAVRYAWENDPPCTLFNKEGLPASPFRTDEWDLEERSED